MDIMNTLPTSAVYGIVNELEPRLHLSFFDKLPHEVCLRILGYLDPYSLANITLASRAGYLLASDFTLWQQLYYAEGWKTNADAIRQFEAELIAEHRRERSRPLDLHEDERDTKRQATPKLVSQDSDSIMVDASTREATPVDVPMSLFGQPSTGRRDGYVPSWDSRTSSYVPGTVRNEENERASRLSTPANIGSENSSDIFTSSSLVVCDRCDRTKKLNWQYLYTQRKRLENNWQQGKYVNFQLPHPDYPQEAHAECIYTLQYDNKYLVSGSRDKTLRIWDLDTRRLVGKPLTGHNGSVLCLQFEKNDKEDLIVSGSSDATIILWQFSTGQPIQIIRNAHRESVLNIRFDERILVTCSKDQMIKIFNRKTLNPWDVGYPGGPILEPVPRVIENLGFNPSPYQNLQPKPPYTIIGELRGHGAAVNAVQIHGAEIVSASGDRRVKVWNWPRQECLKTMQGHNKGIACVNYDGRRIVTGSSDNEVKIFDRESGAEIASLRGHGDLVRTVQAGFGDLPGGADEDKATAKKIDQEFFKAVDSGRVPFSDRERSWERNAGSTNPERITAFGASIPPNGGGSQYGRIVSGSYDETVIIWRRDKEGVWKPQHRFQQTEAARAAIDEFEEWSTTRPSGPPLPGSRLYWYNIIDNAVQHGSAALRQALTTYPQIAMFARLRSAILLNPNEHFRANMILLQELALARIQALLVQYQLHHPPALSAPPLRTNTTAGDPASANGGNDDNSSSTHLPVHHGQPQGDGSIPLLINGNFPKRDAQGITDYVAQACTWAISSPSISNGVVAAQTAAQAAVPNTHAANPPHHNANAAAMAAAMNHAAAAVAAGVAPNQIGPAPVHVGQWMPVPRQGPDPSSARVFRLQFDARRIICCSQVPIIVGWDFANRDPKIEEASRFFGPVE